MRVIIISALLSILLLNSNAIHAQKAEQAQASESKYPDAPEWTLETQDGKEVSFSDFKGKPMLIHFWGTWCPYCKKLHPGLEKIRLEYEPKGLVVLGISVNEPIDAKPQDVLKERGIGFVTLIEGDELAIEGFEIAGTPSTFFISPDGKILGSTMVSDPNDSRFEKAAEYLVNLPR